MAEGILFDAVGRILQVLGSRVFREMELAWSAKDELGKLKDTMDTINAVLLDAEEQGGKKNHGVTTWLRRLKDAVYDADDLLDDFCTELKWREMMDGNKMSKEVRIFFSKSNQVAYSVKMAHKIKTIRERLDEIKNDQQFLLFKHIDNGKGVLSNKVREQTHSYVRPEKVIGRDDDKNEILRVLLMNSNVVENVSVIPIVGIGGIGKTTLVQSVYNVEELLKSVTGNEVGTLEIDQLQHRLRGEIDGRKYLLVLDDVWNENPNRWSELKDLLMNGASGSKIIVTTRSQQVAKVTSQLPIYFLSGLSKDKSWTLFSQTAFEQGKEPRDSRLETIGKEIVSKCAGVPLAIMTLGRLLYDKHAVDDWLSFRDNMLSKIAQEEGDILPILKLSYDYLPSPLKLCFAYCALFPKDYEISKEYLIRLWMAQGFLHRTNNNQCLEDVGNEYFMYLLSRSFLLVLQCDYWRKPTYKMHDLMHDLAELVSGSECTIGTLHLNNVNQRTRHVSFDPELESLPSSIALLKENSLRTLLPLCPRFEKRGLCSIPKLSNFRCLRALKLSSLGIKEVPTSIGKLRQLRYLDLSSNKFEELPNSMSKLINLETLDLCYCWKLKKWPRDMRKMVSLRCLLIEECCSLTSMPDGLGQLTSLRTLPLFLVAKGNRGNEAVRELNGLNKLRGCITIKVLGEMKNKIRLAEANFEAKPFLESIIFERESHGMLDDREHPVSGPMLEGLKPHPNLKKLGMTKYGSVIFSGCMSSFTSLAEIDIIRGRNCQTITPLDQLPSLKRLNLCKLYELEYMCDRVNNTSSILSTSFFPSLETLCICGCFKLRWWKISDDEATTKTEELPQFPCLIHLFIEDCHKLKSMPLFPTLENLTLKRTRSKALQHTIMMKNFISAPSTSSTRTAPLCNLKSLSLTEMMILNLCRSCCKMSLIL